MINNTMEFTKRAYSALNTLSVLITLLICLPSCDKEESFITVNHSEASQPLSKLEARTNEILHPTLSANGWLQFVDTSHFISYMDYLDDVYNFKSIVEKFDVSDSLSSIYGDDFISHYSVLKPYLIQGENVIFEPEFSNHLYINIEDPSLTSIISKKGIVQVGPEIIVFRGKNEIYRADSEFAAPFLETLSDSIGNNLGIEPEDNFMGVWLDEPNIHRFQPGGPSALCPSCYTGPSEPDDLDEDCTFRFSFFAFSCLDEQHPSTLGFSSQVEYGELNGVFEFYDADGDLVFSQNTNNTTSTGFQSIRLFIPNIPIGAYFGKFVGYFQCLATGNITPIDFTDPNPVVIGGSCGGNREVIRTSWETFNEEEQLWYRTLLSSEIYYGAARVKAVATASTYKRETFYWAPSGAFYEFRQYSQWREDDDSCAARDKDDDTESYWCPYYGMSVKNSSWKDSRFWKDGDQFVNLTSKLADQSTIIGSGILVHQQGGCD